MMSFDHILPFTRKLSLVSNSKVDLHQVKAKLEVIIMRNESVRYFFQN